MARTSESHSPSMWGGKAGLGDLRTPRHVGWRAHQEPEPRWHWLKTCDKFTLPAQTMNYPRDCPVPSRQPCRCPSAPALAIPLVLVAPGLRRRLLTWTRLADSHLSPGNSQNARKIWRVLDKALKFGVLKYDKHMFFRVPALPVWSITTLKNKRFSELKYLHKAWHMVKCSAEMGQP